jgi:hypothetical protein
MIGFVVGKYREVAGFSFRLRCLDERLGIDLTIHGHVKGQDLALLEKILGTDPFSDPLGAMALIVLGGLLSTCFDLHSEGGAIHG